MSNGQIFFIGGASGSGKSTAAEALAEELELPLVRLDDYHNMVINPGLNGQWAKELTREICAKVVQNLMDTGARCIIEGGWITVEQAAVWQGNPTFFPVFCGYPSTTAKDRFDLIKQGKTHWLNHKTEKDAIEWLEKQISDSCSYKKSCSSNEVTFIEFSCAEAGRKNLIAHFGEIIGDKSPL
jgi:shikimate kinase